MSKKSRARAAGGAPLSSPTVHRPIRGSVFLAGSLVGVAAWAVYYNSFSGPLIFDDLLAITNNPTLRRLGRALLPPSDTSVGGRPLINLTFALNYAWSGLNVRSYHVVNLLVHALAGLTLFGLVRRTLLRPAMAGLRRAGPPAPSPGTGLYVVDATPLALAVALIWVVHPLQTEAVTYISQRAESLMGLLYLLTLYCFVHGAENQRSESRRQKADAKIQIPEKEIQKPSDYCPLPSVFWFTASVLFCLLGALTKEVIVTAPVMVFLYDRTFVAGSFREAWRRHWRYYLGLAATWIALVHSLMSLGRRSIGFDQGVTGWAYALTSCRSIVRYLKLALWPHPLVFDYGNDATGSLPYVLVLAALVAGVMCALRWRPALGFIGAWFLVILVPASSFVPIADQPMAEHRMYLPLAGVIGLAVIGLYRWWGRRSLILWAVLSVGLGCLTVRRNEDYRFALAIWSDTAAKQPHNARAHGNLGLALAEIPGRRLEAISHYEMALQINPDFSEAHSNLGLALSEIPGRLPEAIFHYEAALRTKPGYAEAHNNLGEALAQIPGRLPEAIVQFETALRIKPDYAEAHSNLGLALATMPGRWAEAISHHEAAVKLRPDSAIAHNNLGVALAHAPARRAEAISEYEKALRIDPGYAEAHYNLGLALLTCEGREPDALAHFETALRIKPDLEPARQMLEKLRAPQSRAAPETAH